MSRRPPVQDSFDGRDFDYATYYRHTVENTLTGTRDKWDPRRIIARNRQKWNRHRGVKKYNVSELQFK